MMELRTFTPYVDQSLIKPWMSKLLELGMECTPHPDVELTSQTGFFPFKLRFLDPKLQSLKGTDILTGFEFHVEKFDLAHELSKLPNNVGVLKTLFSLKPKNKIYATENIDQILSNCKNVIIFNYSSNDVFELRMAYYSSLIIADIANGIAMYPDDNIWYNSEASLSECIAEVETYESSLTEENLSFQKFAGWS